jgi:hypothetical protein
MIGGIVVGVIAIWWVCAMMDTSHMPDRNPPKHPSPRITSAHFPLKKTESELRMDEVRARNPHLWSPEAVRRRELRAELDDLLYAKARKAELDDLLYAKARTAELDDLLHELKRLLHRMP